MTHILITGGCGFIGTNLISFLASTGKWSIRVLDNEHLGKREYLADFPDVDFVHGDIRDVNALKTALRDIECVVHLAADTRVMDSIDAPEHNYTVNVTGSFNLLRVMREMGVTRIINASTGGAILGEATPPVHEGMLPNPASPYGASKLAVEGYLSAFSQSYGFQGVSLRFSNVYGPRSWHKGSVVAHFFKNILNSAPLTIYGDGSQQRDYIHVDDICRAIVLSLEKNVSGIFQIGTGTPTSLSELVTLMRDIVGPDYTVPVVYENFRQGEIRNTWSDVTNAKRQLGFSPAIPLQDGLKRTWQWFQHNWR